MKNSSRALALGVFFGCLSGSAAAGTFDPWVDPARYELEYRVDLEAISAAETDSIRVWLPTPGESPHQEVRSVEVEAPWPHRETVDRYGNRIVYLERDSSPGAGTVVMRVVVERRPSDGIRPGSIPPNTPLDPTRYLSSARRIPLDGVIREIAVEEARGHETAAERIRAFYDYVVRTMRYSKKGEGWGHGDAIWACTSKYGNCTDFHSLFIGMARSQGIPARFLIGFPIPADRETGQVAGYHCWAEAYDPAQEGERLNYFIYPYAEVNGQAVPKVPWTFHFRRLETGVGVPRAARERGETMGEVRLTSLVPAGG